MKIVEYTDDYAGRWDRFVLQQPTGTFFHLTGWKRAVEKAFGHRAHYLLVLEDEQVAAVLPLFLVRSRIFGRFLVSSPFAVYGGICTQQEEARRLLIERTERLAADLKVDYAEYRNRKPDPSTWPQSDLYVTFIEGLPENPEDCLKNLPRKARAAARQSIKFGLQADISLDQLDRHYQLNALQMRRLGSPGLPRSWFRALAEEFNDTSTILTVTLEEQPIASVLVFLFRDTVLPYYSGSMAEYNRYHPNNFMYLKLMEYGVRRGYRFFDFGRSRKDTGPYRFKKHQGFAPQELPYQFYLHRAEEIPNINPSNPKFDVPKRIWRKLPLPVTKWLGPKLVRGIP
jgi:FemAB-related protein (PEP-CTERM system-associated)